MAILQMDGSSNIMFQFTYTATFSLEICTIASACIIPLLPLCRLGTEHLFANGKMWNNEIAGDETQLLFTLP